MANHQDSSHSGNADGHTPTGRGPGYTQVSSRLHGAAEDVSELLDLLTAGVAADESTAVSRVAGEDVAPGDRPQGGCDRGDSL